MTISHIPKPPIDYTVNRPYRRQKNSQKGQNAPFRVGHPIGGTFSKKNTFFHIEGKTLYYGPLLKFHFKCVSLNSKALDKKSYN